MGEPRVLVVGAGISGVLLARRLRDAGADALLIGPHDGAPHGRPADATAASGGLVRAFEPDPAARALAAASLAELLADSSLATAAGWRRTGSLYLLDAASAAGVDGAETLTGDEVARRFGFAGLPDGTVGIWEDRAGYLEPDRLRRTVLRGLGRTEPTPVARLGDGVVELVDGRRLTGDLVVVAAGAWTPRLLRAAGMPATLRTKHIQYARYATRRDDLPCFVDESSGLYGRPAGPGRVLLGLPSDRWDVDPPAPEPDAALAARVPTVAARRLPGLDPRPAGSPVSAADCYSEPAGLALRHVTGAVHTFTGGSGGAAKTVLAASRLAATALLNTRTAIPVPHGQTEADS
ncbi:FAD-binding oxidoreductase [Micromonospora sp. WMMA1947]|uniref:NAD(P)/FAD-dependent oxidoreductase n=1 Tax=Micromonospora sp. WMMA1947 TaxID=3015163 RepID=UPI00248C4E19|nr:FAD-binding oxidoreductase [Micromonospora sp. WMMA1947]WBC07685.1 FAD-binding oxidoreductase [Micromonospora sp. WMMA1947]